MKKEDNSAEIRDLIILVVIGIGLFFLSKILVKTFAIWVIVGILLGIAGLRIVTHPLQGISNPLIKNLFKFFAVVIPVLWFVQGGSSIPSEVHLENWTDGAVEIYQDGSLLVTAQPNSTQMVKIYPGSYQFLVQDPGTGGNLDTIQAEVAKGSTYILNVDGAMTYFIGTAVYSQYDFGQNNSPEDEEVDSHWFEVEVDYLFENPPKEIQITGSGSSATRTYCQRASDMLNQYLESGEIDMQELLKGMSDSLGNSLDSTGINMDSLLQEEELEAE